MALSVWSWIKREVDYEVQRYSSAKEHGKIFALLIYYLIFTITPILTKKLVPSLRQYLQDKHIYIFLLVMTVVGVTVVFNLVMWWVYTSKIPFLQQYRQKPWPWEEDRQKWMKLLKRSLIFTAFSQLVVTPILLLLDATIQFSVDMDVENAPSFGQMLPHFLVFQIMEDIMFFSSHWLLHTPWLYKYHKIHHQYTTTVSIAGLHSHIVQFLLANTVTAGVYMMMAQEMFGPIHINARVIWIVLRMWDAYNGHSGYMFTWAPLQLLPFCAADDYHDFHHSRNCGNYAGQFRLLDSAFGFNQEFWKYKAEQKMKKRQ